MKIPFEPISFEPITKPMHHPTTAALLQLDVLGFLSSFTLPS